MYRYFNKNSHNNFIDDCVIRCISTLTDRTWRSVYDEMSRLAGDVGLMFDNVSFVENYLDERYPRVKHYEITVGEFAREHPYGRYAVTVNNHITPIINGNIIDTFDPSDRVIRGVWKIR